MRISVGRSKILKEKRNSGAEKYNYWDEKFIRGVWNRCEEAEDEIGGLEDRTTAGIESEEQKEKGLKKVNST